MRIRFKVLRRLGVTAILLMLAAAVWSAAAAAPAQPDRMHIDTAAGSYATGSTTLSGWAIAADGIQIVTVDVYNSAGKYLGTCLADYGIASASVASTYPDYSGAAQAGFSLNLGQAVKGLKLQGNATYLFNVIATDRNGQKNMSAVKLFVPPDRMYIDNAAGSTVTSSSTLTGWAIAADGIRNVSVDVYNSAGKYLGSYAASYGGASTPVGSTYSNYPNAGSSAFSFSIGKIVSALKLQSNATYLFNVIAFNNRGQENMSAVKLQVSPDRMHIDTAAGSYATGSTTLSGWAIAADGIQIVTVDVYNSAGKYLGTCLADYGIASASVASTYPDYSGAVQAGFSLNLGQAVKGLKLQGNATYLFNVIATDRNGQKNMSAVKLFVPPDRMYIDTAAGSYATGSTQLLGWAIAADGIRNVSVDVYDSAGKYLGSYAASYGGVKTSVKNVYPGYPNEDNCVFSFDLGKLISTLKLQSNATYLFNVIAFDNHGQLNMSAVKLFVPPDRMHIDTAAGSFATGSSTLAGWAIAADGIRNVSVDVYNSAGKYLGSYAADYGGATASVASTYSDYPNASQAGFSFDLGKLVSALKLQGNGTYLFNVIAFNNHGQENMSAIKLFVPGDVTYSMSLSYLQSVVGGNPDLNLIDPAVLTANAQSVYQFMVLSNPGGITVDQMNSMLKGQGVLEGQGQAFLDAAAAFNINPVYLAAHAILESGHGTSKLSTGEDKNGDFIGYYNVYGIGAYDSDPVTDGNNYAENNGWDSVYKAIYGGAQWIYKNYIWGSPRPQYTLYMMRWDPGFYELEYEGNQGTHQPSEYATDQLWANKIAGIIYQYRSLFTGLPIQYTVPQFNEK